MLRVFSATAIALLIALAVSGVAAGKTQKCAKSSGHKQTRHLISSSGAENAFLDNGVLRLGVVSTGALNAYIPEWLDTTRRVSDRDASGLQYYGYKIDGLFADATSPGCTCEGFGVAGFVNSVPETEAFHSTADENTFVSSSVSSPTTTEATTTAVANGTDGGELTVVHHFRPSPATPKLYEVNVTITNTGSVDFDELHYVRTMDWDIAPYEFEECIDINLGTTGTDGDVVCAHFNGFATPSPSVVDGQTRGTPSLGSCSDDPTKTVEEKFGPIDYGSAWHFKFRDISATNKFTVGSKKSFLIYYGAADSDADANAVLAASKIEAYSFGYARTDDSQCTRSGVRFIFGFGNVGGVSIVPSTCGDDCAVKNARDECGASAASATSDSNCVSLNFDGSDSCF